MLGRAAYGQSARQKANYQFQLGRVTWCSEAGKALRVLPFPRPATPVGLKEMLGAADGYRQVAPQGLELPAWNWPEIGVRAGRS